MRNSDPDAALYYLARMLEAGEDPSLCSEKIDSFFIRGYRSCQSKRTAASDCHIQCLPR